MQVEVKIDTSYTNVRVLVMAASMTGEVQEILTKLSSDVPKIISGSRDGKVEVLDEKDMIRIYAANGRVFAVTERGEYTVRLRLYEIEERLDMHQFVRISNSEIINIKKVSNFDLSFSGTICVKLENGTVTYVSRRYVARIKKFLGM